jgi:hypothetical protein
MRYTRLLPRRWKLLAGTALTIAIVAVVIWNFARPAPSEPVVTLRVNRSPAADVAAGAPVTFELFLTGTHAGREIAIGSWLMPWHCLVHFEEADTGRSLRWDLERLGAPRSTQYSRRSDGGVTASSVSSRTARVRGLSVVHAAAWAVAPEDSLDITPGKFLVRAVVETPWWWPASFGWRGRSASAAVQVTVRAAQPGAWDERQAQNASEFYLSARRFQDAERVALEWTRRSAKSANAFAAFAQSLEGLGRDAEALTAYRTALQLVPKSPEEPRYLLDRLSALMRRTRRVM